MKKLLSLVLVASLLLVLTACGAQPTTIPNPALVMAEKYLADLDYEQAIVQFDQAIKIEARNPRGYLGKADALLQLERQDEAADVLAVAAKKAQKDQREDLKAVQEEIRKSPEDGFVSLSSAYEKLGWRELALSLLRRATAKFPDMQKIVSALKSLSDTLGSDSEIIGSVMQFGSYDWIVLDVQEPYVLVLAKDVIEQRAYESCEPYSSLDEWQRWPAGNASVEFSTGWEPHAASAHGTVTWETCSLRKYLNDEFYNQFSPEEKSRIRLTRLENSDNDVWHTLGGNDTNDYVFLLSLDEAEKYRSLLAGASWWWLRTPYDFQYKIEHVYPDGNNPPWGACIDDVTGSVRPAMYIQLT